MKCGRNLEPLAAPNAMQTSIHVVVMHGCIVIDGCTSLACNSTLAMDAQDTTAMIVHQKYWLMRRVELISKCLRSVQIVRSISVLIAREWNVARLVLDVTSMSALTVTL